MIEIIVLREDTGKTNNDDKSENLKVLQLFDRTFPNPEPFCFRVKKYSSILFNTFCGIPGPLSKMLLKPHAHSIILLFKASHLKEEHS